MINGFPRFCTAVYNPHAYLLVAVTKAFRDRGSVFTPWDYAECLREIEAALATEGESPEGWEVSRVVTRQVY